MAMFENISEFFKRFMQSEKKELLAENPTSQSKEKAKDRLHVVLMQDRANVSADFLELMKEEIIEVIKKYIVVDEDKIDVRLTNEENDDGSLGAPLLHANIPILNVRNDLKGTYMNQTPSDKIEGQQEINVESNNAIEVPQENKNVEAKEEKIEEPKAEEQKSEETAQVEAEVKAEEVKTEESEAEVEETEPEKSEATEAPTEETQSENSETEEAQSESVEIKIEEVSENSEPEEESETTESEEESDEDDDDVAFDDLLKAAEAEEQENEKKANKKSIQKKKKTSKKRKK